ncbi:hypothetical protein FE257_003604 [Aspergillus nanangensis]|uniref:Rhodopsin domain-containing protein n=1 Tax=Aspergillus nanangensis TaxID=2582783 RepID=A0AAD4CSG7_ASPNN|nr:hypothetical protein FE257_003604 [Aspergillus nanangensis]
MASDSQGPTVSGVALAFAVLTAVVLSLRLFSRIYVLRKMGIDDYLIIFACLFAWAFSAITVVAVKQGLGSHIEDVPLENMETYALAVWLSSMFYLTTLGFIKTSVCVFYTRLGDRLLTRLSLAMIAIVGCQATSFVLVAAFQCSPIDKAWASTKPGHCVDINVFYLANAALNILTDLMTYTLPIRVISKLQMPIKQKAVLVVILCLGLFACVSSIIRITYIPTMLSSADATYAIAGAMYWSVIEINVGIFAASIPSFKAIASRFLPRLIGEYSGRKGYGAWSSTDARKYGSGFSKVQDRSGINIGTLRGTRTDPDGVGTQIHSGFTRTGSEDRIIVPEGKIFAHTEIETNVEDSRDYRNRSPSFDHR